MKAIKTQLTEHEATIERGMKAFVEVGLALTAIRDSKLYKENHDTFEDYIKERWGWTARRAQQLMLAAEVAEKAKYISHFEARNSQQAEVLASVPEEQLPAVIEKVKARVEAGEKQTAKLIKQEANKMKEPSARERIKEALSEAGPTVTNRELAKLSNTSPSQVSEHRIPGTDRMRDKNGLGLPPGKFVPEPYMKSKTAEMRKDELVQSTIGHMNLTLDSWPGEREEFIRLVESWLKDVRKIRTEKEIKKLANDHMKTLPKFNLNIGVNK